MLIFLSAIPSGRTQDKNAAIEIGSIDYFGYEGLDLQSVQSHLVLRAGQSITQDRFYQARTEIQASIQKETGHPTSDIAGICCDGRKHLLIYIGLNGSSTHANSFLPAPVGDQHLDSKAVALYDQEAKSMEEAVNNGAGGEDWSQGYALSKYPATKDIQLQVRAYALDREAELQDVLRHAQKAKDREVSAYFLGYAKRSSEQIKALNEAASDSDQEVRNNAVRALTVLSSATDADLQSISPEPLIRLLYSGEWTDRNKGSLLLSNLTQRRNPALLEQLRRNALPPLIEGARWTSIGHATPFLVILGRIDGLSDKAIQKETQADRRSHIIHLALAAK